MKHIKLNTVNLKDHKTIREDWIHAQIKADASILGLGNLFVKDHERIHHGKGRLDMVLQENDSNVRYEVEIQLGATDPSHIIRTIEYWDLERKRYPQYEHTAVIIAEDITSRFLNVISLFNGSIPIIAIQMTAVELEGGVGLIFTRILDLMPRGLVDEDEVTSQPADRAFWEAKTTPKTMKIADQILDLCKPFSGNVEFNYNRPYIGFRVDGSVFNFASCYPSRRHLILTIKHPQTGEIDEELEKMGFDLLGYDSRWKQYRIRLTPGDLEKNQDYLGRLLRRAFDRMAE